MAKFTGKNIEFKDLQKAIFGSEDDSAIYWDGDQLVITTVASGVDPTADGHLITKRYLETTTSGIPYIDEDDGDVYFYDPTREKDLGVAILEIGCGRNSANTTNQYLRTYNGTPMNQTGIALPWDATLIGGAAMGAVNTQTWTVRLRKNDSATNIASLTVTNSYEAHVTNADIDFDEGDRIQIYMEGTNINYPQARLYFRRRK